MQDIISNNIKLILLMIVSMYLASCGKYNKFYFIENEGAIMPVKIRGNADSHAYLVLLPGGPAGEGLVYSKVFNVFKKQLEPKFKMVYYDQRGAGNSQGHYHPSSLNLEQLSDDLNYLVKSIRVRDPLAKIYLMGYSFGGTLGLYYLTEGNKQSTIDGFISIAGAFDRKEQKQNQQKLVEHLLDQWVTEGALANYDAIKSGYTCGLSTDIEKCKLDSVATLSNVNRKVSELGQFNKFKLSAGSVSRLLGYVFFSQSNAIQSGINEGQNGKYFQEEFDEQMLTEKAAAIKIPVLLINGRYDTNVPFFEAKKLYRNLDTPSHHKKLVILEKSGHLPMFTEPEKLAENIISFIEANPD